MSKGADNPAADNRGLLGEFEDFGQSALHTALESPINGCIQLIDHAANAHLPELKIIGAPTHDSLGTKAGAVVGAAADLIALSVATGGVADILGATGVVGGVVTAAATGAIYGGVLTPTDANSKHFYADRLTNGAIGAAAFATMNGAAQALGATGLWAAPEARTLLGSLSFGGLAGAAGGVTTAETTALLKERKLLPSSAELTSSIATSAAFGAAYGGLGYAFNHLAGPASQPVEVKSGPSSITTVNNADGQPVSFKYVVPALDEPDDNVIVNGTQMANGTWKTSAFAVLKSNGEWDNQAYAPKVQNVARAADGTVTVSSDEGDVRVFADGQYSKANPTAEAEQARINYASSNFDRATADGGREISSDEGGYQRFDAQGRTVKFADAQWGNGAKMTYGSDGKLSKVSLTSEDYSQNPVYLTNSGPDTWTRSIGDDLYTWKGQIIQSKDPTTGAVTKLTFQPEGGQPVDFDANSGTNAVDKVMFNTSQYKGISPDLGFAKAAGNDSVTLKGTNYIRLRVNGNDVTGETTVKPGDNVQANVDVGDRWAEWEIRPLSITRSANGKIAIDGHEISGERPINLANIVTNKPTTTPKPTFSSSADNDW